MEKAGRGGSVDAALWEECCWFWVKKRYYWMGRSRTCTYQKSNLNEIYHILLYYKNVGVLLNHLI